MSAQKPVEARYGRVHNIGMAVVAVVMIVGAVVHFATNSTNAPTLSLNDPRFVLFFVLAVAMGYYVFLGVSRFMNREPQIVIDGNGILLGFGRDRRRLTDAPVAQRHPTASDVQGHGTICSAWWRCPRRTRYVSKSFRSMVETRLAPSVSAATRSDASARSMGRSACDSISSNARVNVNRSKNQTDIPPPSMNSRRRSAPMVSGPSM